MRSISASSLTRLASHELTQLVPAHLLHVANGLRQSRSYDLWRGGRPAERLGQQELDRLQPRLHIDSRKLDTRASAAATTANARPSARRCVQGSVEQGALKRVQVRGRELRKRGPDRAGISAFADRLHGYR